MLTQTRILRASWSSTLRLPKSSFPARPLPDANAKYLRRCTDELYRWQRAGRGQGWWSMMEGRPEPNQWPGTRSKRDEDRHVPDPFTLHDGPPYANGPLHIGHALNKITKDIICRFQVGQGKTVSYIPGWDCHGLPIEIKALQAQKKDANADPVSVREAARELATRTIEEQQRGFKEWAVMGDWYNAYKTMDRDFEIRQLEVFKHIFEKGLIYRQNKPVYWSPSSRTALAEAELEYDENHLSQTAFVRFPVAVSDQLKNGALSGVSEPLNIIIWTTTPWTLPANKAVAVHNDLQYVVVRDPGMDGELTILGASRLDYYKDVLGRELEVVLEGLRGFDLAGHLQYSNPFQKANGPQPVIHAAFVSDASGTGLVHLAPGHGMDDYHVCSALGIPAFAPVDDAGALTEEAFPERPDLLQGLPVQTPDSEGQVGRLESGTETIVDYLLEQNLLRASQSYTHKYPIDWRTKQPVIIRATEQWFANVDGIKEAAMKALDQVEFIPHGGRARLESFIQGRSQWCISRQRAWGVPIPALYRVDEGKYEATMDSDIIQHILDVVKERGIDTWWTDPEDDPAWVPKHLTGSYIRGRDTMDVWFDSGTSWTLLPPNKDQPVADVYFEGTDQHRGWFQSSLLTHVATQDSSSKGVKPPFKTLITHGFTLDSEGRKMSKSLGNVISPSQITSGELLPPIKVNKSKSAKPQQATNGAKAYDAMGPDALRLWVASSDYTKDVTIGQPVLQSVNQALHKYRVTFKWLLGVLNLPGPTFMGSINAARNDIPYTSFTHFYDDSSSSTIAQRLAIYRLHQVSQEVHAYYSRYEFFKGVNTLNKYIANDLSAFYFETLKDHIYTGSISDCTSAQHILAVIFYELLQMLAPICPLLVEEVWDHVDEDVEGKTIHPARQTWKPLQIYEQNDKPEDYKLFEKYAESFGTLSSAIKAAQERLRVQKKMGSSLECDVIVGVSREPGELRPNDGLKDTDTHFRDFLVGDRWWNKDSRYDENLANLFVVSRVRVVATREVDALRETWLRKKESGEDVWWEEERIQIKEGEEVVVLVAKPSQHKCPRCWRYLAEEKESLCGRCEDVVKEREECDRRSGGI
ncbi:tRNA synthetases class I-domain-containing protein [Clohesyomyces aquaticus]|uniref:Isoleucine--tRNA ligase, mitochondrial n=1 Tax=Clohesyomyces aquaticus TaxID=1231657 RepID=A0A1Y1ZKG6_9PLEO|nr:tRNA synthetases class I-domain-containing protein [Clohesyomyces aquaticus]